MAALESLIRSRKGRCPATVQAQLFPGAFRLLCVLLNSLHRLADLLLGLGQGFLSGLEFLLLQRGGRRRGARGFDAATARGNRERNDQ